MLVAQLCPTLCDPVDCSLLGSSVHGILQTRILEWVAIPFSRGSFQPRDWTQVSYIAGRFFTIWTIRKAQKFRVWVLKNYTNQNISLNCHILQFLKWHALPQSDLHLIKNRYLPALSLVHKCCVHLDFKVRWRGRDVISSAHELQGAGEGWELF